MVVSPKELENIVNENDIKILKEFERNIDSALKDRYFAGTSVHVDFPRGVKNYPKFIAKIKEMYANAGWDAEYYSDQREGTFLTLKEKGDNQYGR